MTEINLHPRGSPTSYLPQFVHRLAIYTPPLPGPLVAVVHLPLLFLPIQDALYNTCCGPPSSRALTYTGCSV